MLSFSSVVQAIDSHTAGEPTRILTGGLPAVQGATMAHKREQLFLHHDHLRRALVHEPRGHDAIVLAYLLPPCDPEAHLGVVFANDAGYLGTCGHGSIGVAMVAVATGMVPAVAPESTVVLDTPAGLVRCAVKVTDGRPVSVRITNVPSFLWRRDVPFALPDGRKGTADVAYGGNWFAFVDARSMGLSVDPSRLGQLMSTAMAIREALRTAGVRGTNPHTGHEEDVDHVKLYASLVGTGTPGSRAITLCPGSAYDRSPCGTGTSAKLAVLHARGELGVGTPFCSDSVLGTRFMARIASTTTVCGIPAIVPEVEGAAFVTGFQTFVLDPADPLVHGFTTGPGSVG